MICPDRRKVLEGLGAAAAMQLVPSLAFAASPTSHALKFGDNEITVVSDGHLTIPTRFLCMRSLQCALVDREVYQLS